MDFDDICLNLDDNDDVPSYSSSKSQSHIKSSFQSKSNNKRDDYKTNNNNNNSSNNNYNNKTNVKLDETNHKSTVSDSKVKSSSSNIDNNHSASEKQIHTNTNKSCNKNTEKSLPPSASFSASITQVKVERPLWQESEDPNRYHANPTYLSKDALLKPHDTVISNLIFSRIEFKSLSIDPKLVSVLTEPTSSGGLQLKTSTRIQSVTIPLLSSLNNVLMKSQTGSG